MKRFRALSCFVFALCLVFYAVPRLPFHGISEEASGFSLIWITFAMLVIGSNLMFVIGSDRSGLDKRQRRKVFYPAGERALPVKADDQSVSLSKRNQWND